MVDRGLPPLSHNDRLREQVHPPAWRNPKPAPRYNLVVIGGGTAGLVAAAGAASLGARVALIERGLLGGDCLNVGCVPSKSLLRAARAAAEARRAPGFGLRIDGGVAVDFAAVMEEVRRLRADLSPHDSAERLRGFGVDVFFGEGQFVGTDAVAVEGVLLRFKRAVVATGARAVTPPIPGLDEAGALTNETVFNLTERPDRLLVVGGGPLGCELAQAFARLGSEVTLVQRGPRLLPREDPDAADVLAEALRRDGIRLHFDAAVERVEGKRALLSGGGAVDADAVLVGVGRAPNVAGLGLDAVGVAFDERAGVRVNDFLQTTNPRVYACGDVCLEEKFTHAADATARVVVQNALFHGRKRLSRLTIPRCTYTSPEIAHVGLSEREASRTFTVPMADVDRAVTDREAVGFVKIHVAARSDRIVGATIVGQHAGEMIGEVAVAMAGGVGLGRLSGVIHPYPTQADAIRQAGDVLLRSRLTPGIQRLLKLWLALTR